MKKFYFLLAILGIAISASAQVVINEVYGAGGNSGSVLKNDFIELYNNGSTAVSLVGWSVQYASATGSSWAVTSLTGSIPANGYYLVQEASGGAGSTVDIPTPDATGTINMAASAGKVLLCNVTAAQTGASPSSSQVIDFVGYGSTANGSETSPAPAPSATTSIQRSPEGHDSNNNNADFKTGTPTPSNRSTVVSAATITAAPGTLSGFSTTSGTSSAAQTITAGGSGLTADITATPTAPYEISIDGGTTYSSSAVTLTQTGGNVAGTSVNVRIAASASSGTANGTVTFSSTGASNQVVTLQGQVDGSGSVAVVTLDTSTIVPFSTTAPAASSTESFTVSGTNISNGGISFFPSGSFEISVDGGTTFVANPQAASIPATGGVVNQTTVLVRISANAPRGVVTGLVMLFTTGQSQSQAVHFTGTVNAAAANVVVNQVYGGGGNSGAYYKNDFIELYNDADTAVNLNGWSVQYGSASGTSWQVHALSGTVPAHSFFLSQESAGANASAVNLPTPDATGTLALSGTSGKVILSNSVTAQTGANPTGALVIDKVGYGTANGYEASPAGTTDNTTGIQRVTAGVDNNNNATDFAVKAPVPRNTSYITTPPTIVSLTPANTASGIPSTIHASINFDKPLVKATGTITLYTDGVAGTPLDVNDAGVVVNNNIVSLPFTFSPGGSYYILISAGAFTDVYGNAFAGITSPSAWAFTTYNSAVATPLPANFDFQNCTGNGLLPNGFTQYSVTGAQIWDCTPFGRDPSAPAGTAAFPNGVQINGYANGVNNLNKDWLISPKLDLTGSTYPLLSFWSRNAFAGDPLELKISTDYTGSGDPSLATWTDLNGKFPSQGSDVWTASSNINLSAYKQGSVYIAFVYTSTTDDGSRWTLDDINIVNSATPPPASLTLSASNLQFGYTATGASTVKTLTLTANDITGDITLNTSGNFQVSVDGGTTYASTATILQAVGNNVPQTLYVRFSPATNNVQYNETLTVGISDTTAVVTLKGNSIDPASTLTVVNWNLNWFATPDLTLGPANKSLQQDNVATVLKSIPADLFALQEVVNQHALDSIVQTMPGYAYIINNYGSYSNPNEPTADPLNQVQKLAFVYKTSKFTNIHTDSLLTKGVTTATDVSNPYYNAFASGRFPYMMTADVTLSDNNGGFITQPMRFINIHGKANTAPVQTAYDRRAKGAKGLDSLIQADYATDNVIILGDFNDDLNQTITAGVTPPISSYSPFTIDDAGQYIFPTKPLSPAGQHSDVSYSSVIDNVIATSAVGKFYLPASATVLSDVANLVPKYGTTTTDHYPVFTQYSFSTAAALPVKLISFTAVARQAQVNLAWSTASEQNSKAFEVERSTDGSKFVQIGTVAAKGNSQTKSDYTFIDAQPASGSDYYRLKQVDVDGKSVYSGVVKVTINAGAGIRITPNPASDYIYVTLQNLSSVGKLQILDLNGKVVRQEVIAQGTGNKSVTLLGLSKGLYTVKLVTNNTITTQKLVIH